MRALRSASRLFERRETLGVQQRDELQENLGCRDRIAGSTPAPATSGLACEVEAHARLQGAYSDEYFL